MTEPRICYVIMPFDKRYTSTYRDGIQQALIRVARERGEQWDCRRSDDVRVPGSITKEIVSSLHTADLVVADLTGNNPNVFYELGVVHSSGRPTIMITQNVNALPFDVTTYRVHPYEPSPSGLAHLSDFLVTTILEALADKNESTNPVLDFAPIRHSRIILGLRDVRTVERQVNEEVWLMEPSFDTDLTMFGDIIKSNLLDRGVRYRYIVPATREAARQWARLVKRLGYDVDRNDTLQIRTVEPHLIESEVVIYDPYSLEENVMIMSPRDQEYVFWYRVGKTRGEDIRDRFEFLWEGHATPIKLG